MSTTTASTTTDNTNDAARNKNRAACDGYVRAGLTGNTTIQFLIQNLVRMGCTPPEGFIQCLDCEGKPVSGGFGMLQEESIVPDANNHNSAAAAAAAAAASPSNPPSGATGTKKRPDCAKSTREILDQFRRDREGETKLSLRPEIYICQEHVSGPKHANTILVHELIHAIDVCRAKMDPLRNCMQLACTEIRAENLSGECDPSWEFLRGKLNDSPSIFGHGKRCARRRAIDSVRANPNCTERAELYVDAAMERCYADTFPFERHPNQK